jgi:hypothetical protein
MHGGAFRTSANRKNGAAATPNSSWNVVPSVHSRKDGAHDVHPDKMQPEHLNRSTSAVTSTVDRARDAPQCPQAGLHPLPNNNRKQYACDASEAGKCKHRCRAVRRAMHGLHCLSLTLPQPQPQEANDKEVREHVIARKKANKFGDHSSPQEGLGPSTRGSERQGAMTSKTGQGWQRERAQATAHHASSEHAVTKRGDGEAGISLRRRKVSNQHRLTRWSSTMKKGVLTLQQKYYKAT